MGEAFENWFKNEMLPAECDDERVIVGLKICWEDALLHAADIAERATMNTEDLSSNEKIAVVITAERIVAAILKDADG